MKSNKVIGMTVIVAALGYFVDIYDLLLFGIVRVPSLRSIGVTDENMLSEGLKLLNYQMTGMLIGGVFWGVLGDRRGRRSVLFGSILMYSLANIANAFVTDVNTYAILRFVAGVGLAGELGAAVTLVAEVMSKESRGYGTAIVAAIGILGAVVGALVGDHFTWQTAYLIGGFMGLALLLLRAGLLESSMFENMKGGIVGRGAFHQLFTSKERLVRYLSCIAIGTPIWFVIGILITFSPELGSALGIEGVSAGKAIMWSYSGLAIGDLLSGLLSQWIKSRKKSVLIFMTLTLLCTFYYVNAHNISLSQFYTLCAVIGFGAGYWAVFITIAAEQFGTNLRATVATSVPNFVRGAVVPITISFEYLRNDVGLLNSALMVGVFCFTVGFIALYLLKETYGKDLDFYEEL
jgi:MFS family permease